LQESDISQINQLFTDTVHAVNIRDYAQEQLDIWAPKNRTAEHWKTRLKDHIAYVADADGLIVGFADITKDGYVDHVYAHKDFQGHGIASALLQRLEKDAQAMGLHELRTEASITAKPFFEKRGFTVTSKQDKTFNGMTFTNYCMCKKI
ncbi:MAG: GNAT family N-acetyltransferase, partial [Candidatus Babeliales bacterium]